MTGYETQSDKEAQFWVAYERIKAKPEPEFTKINYQPLSAYLIKPEVRPLKLKEIA